MPNVTVEHAKDNPVYQVGGTCHPSVLVRASRLPKVARDEIVELVQDAWLSRASRRRAEAWLAEQGPWIRPSALGRDVRA